MRRLEMLDYARLAAALAVMAFHYLFNGLHNGKITSDISAIPGLTDVARYGALGVSLFFMISGYVIFFTARGKTAGQFATSRAVRLYPAFWVCLLITAGFAAFWGTEKMAVTLPQVLVNITMVPQLFGVKAVDGVYWTLLLELVFYGAVFLILLLGLGRYLDRIFLWWPVGMLAAWAAGIGKLPLLGGYYAFFAAGALFALMRERITLPALASLGATLFLALNGAVARAQATSDTKGIEFSPYVICGLILAFYLFFFALNTRKGQAVKLPASRLAGGLTYPIYLLHAHIGYMLLSQFGTEQNKAIAYVLVSAFVIVLAYAVHEMVERRLAGFWQAFFTRWLGRPLDVLQALLRRPRLVR